MAAHDGEISAEFGMRIGKNYQAEIPDLVQDPARDLNLTRQMASLMWTPNSHRLDAKVDFYLEHATTRFNYSQEQALGLLLWHHHNVDVAVSDLGNFAQTPDDWTEEERTTFERALGRYGKNFNKIHDLMPDKSVGSLVKFYYSWKKSKKPLFPTSRNFSGLEDAKASYDSDFQQAQDDQIRRKAAESWPRVRARTRVPYDLHLDSRDLKLIARGYSDHMTRQLENELANCKGKVASNKDVIQTLRSNISEGIGQFKRPQLPLQQDNKWSNTELLLAMQGLKYFGKDFRSVSELLGSKSEHLVRNLYFNHHFNHQSTTNRCCSIVDSSDGNVHGFRESSKSKSPEECKITHPNATRLAITMATNKTFQGQGHKNFLQHSQPFYKDARPVRVVTEK